MKNHHSIKDRCSSMKSQAYEEIEKKGRWNNPLLALSIVGNDAIGIIEYSKARKRRIDLMNMIYDCKRCCKMG
jgi:hypothetical protein